MKDSASYVLLCHVQASLLVIISAISTFSFDVKAFYDFSGYHHCSEAAGDII